jgi:CelD/BcsL family acetyltransferase involved in cellulose biosynthesis
MALQATMGGVVATAARSLELPALAVTMTHDLAAVTPIWEQMQAAGIESPGQNLAFVRAWVAAQAISAEDQFYLVAERAGRPVALLALWRRRSKGLRTMGFFPGSHVGCDGPLVDRDALLAMGSVGRAALWSAMLAGVEGADLIHLKAVPELNIDGIDLFAELGESTAGDMLYRASFASWTEADTTQRSKSRRKHDRQQGDKLAAMGEVTFEELRATAEHRPILDLMFRQRAARFVAMGVSDPFADPAVRAFYDATLDPASGVDVRMHVLRLNGDIVAVRYNIAHKDRLFCLISSMSTEATLQPGSPGKQCLLRVMQSIFDAGWRVFDMGAGLTDEKRHWCNVQIPVSDHFVPLNWRGEVATAIGRHWQTLRSRIKSDPRLMRIVKAIRGRLHRSSGSPDDQAGSAAE